jgi:chromate transport protein ChrA
MVTPFFSALVVGLPKPVASGLQLATAALACVAVWHVFRRYPPSPMRTAVLIAATFLVSPYMLMYDMLLLMPAVVMLYLYGVRSGFLPLEPFIHAGLWVTPTLCMGFSRHGLPYAPLAILAFGAMAVWRLKREDQRVSTRAESRLGTRRS